MISNLQYQFYEQIHNYLIENNIQYVDIGYYKNDDSFLIKLLLNPKNAWLISVSSNKIVATYHILETAFVFSSKNLKELNCSYYIEDNFFLIPRLEENVPYKGKNTLYLDLILEYSIYDILPNTKVYTFMNILLSDRCNESIQKTKETILSLIQIQENKIKEYYQRLNDLLHRPLKKKDTPRILLNFRSRKNLEHHLEQIFFPQKYITNNISLYMIPEFNPRIYSVFSRHMKVSTFNDLKIYFQNNDIFSTRGLGPSLINNLVNVIDLYGTNEKQQHSTPYNFFTDMIDHLATDFSYNLVLASIAGYSLTEISNACDLSLTAISNRIKEFYKRLEPTSTYLINHILQDNRHISYDKLMSSFENEDYSKILIECFKQDSRLTYHPSSNIFLH